MKNCRPAAILFVVVFVFGLLSFSGQEEQGEPLLLKVGDKRFKDKVLEITPGEIYSAETGGVISFSKMIQEMKRCTLIYVGETHNSLPMHDIQLKIIQALSTQGDDLSLGLEMFTYGWQEVLTKWTLGILSRDEFIHQARWYENWNFNFGFYQKIFEFAKENRIPVYGLNAPREIITKIRMKGWEALSEEERRLVPQPDLSNQDHRTLIRAIFESMDLPHQMKGSGLEMVFEGLYRAQSAWDEVMSENAIINHQRDGRKMVILAGSGHLIYNLGINRRAFEKNRLPSKTVICVTVPTAQKSVQVARSLGDYIWGIPEEEKPAFPSVGLRLKKFEGLENLVIESKPIDGVAKGQDFDKGDIILSVDNRPFTDINELRTYLSGFIWGDEVKIRLLRAAQEKEVTLLFKTEGT